MPRTSTFIYTGENKKGASVGVHIGPFRNARIVPHLPCSITPGSRTDLLQTSDHEKHSVI